LPQNIEKQHRKEIMETNKEHEIKRKRGRPPINRTLNGNPPKYHLKAPQQDEEPKEVIIRTEQRSPSVGVVQNASMVVSDPTHIVTQRLEPRETDKPAEERMAALKELVDDFEEAKAGTPKDIRQNPMADLIPVEAIEFTNGKNTLKILLSRRHNRMYRVQIFLNDSVEIRPTTYTGFAPASTFWGFLKEITKQ